ILIVLAGFLSFERIWDKESIGKPLFRDFLLVINRDYYAEPDPDQSVYFMYDFSNYSGHLMDPITDTASLHTLFTGLIPAITCLCFFLFFTGACLDRKNYIIRFIHNADGSKWKNGYCLS
ncbi:MAG TPA: hypothetical protein PLU43_08825, partial [Lachnospiraceae bacterium]|nr:hypothetical protein [Lachnospiraceae bacterium]